jgi:hypothetical protein
VQFDGRGIAQAGRQFGLINQWKGSNLFLTDGAASGEFVGELRYSRSGGNPPVTKRLGQEWSDL